VRLSNLEKLKDEWIAKDIAWLSDDLAFGRKLQDGVSVFSRGEPEEE
jgi:hypothetical protein